MAHYRASESKREQFRRYLEKTGVLDGLTNALVTLYEETDKPNDALDFIKQNLGQSGGAPGHGEALREEMVELQQKYDLLLQENMELSQKLSQFEPQPEEGTAE